VTLSVSDRSTLLTSRIARIITEHDDLRHVRLAHGKIRVPIPAPPASRSRSIAVSIHEESFFPGITAEPSESLE